MVEIQFSKGIKETSLPIIKLTRSKNGRTGTATFVFLHPKIMNDSNFLLNPITGMYLLWNQKKIFTTDIHLLFSEGKPFLIKAILIFKSQFTLKEKTNG